MSSIRRFTPTRLWRSISTTPALAHNTDLATPAPSTSLPSSTSASASPIAKAKEPEPLYPLHVPINSVQQAILAGGSALATLRDTHRHDMLAVLSETTSGPFLPPLLAEMRSTPSGRAIMRDRPRITEANLDLKYLSGLPEGTLGREYIEWLRRNKVTPDTRDPVRYVPDPLHAYLLQRYRESHDFYHVLLGFGVALPSEIVVKWFELANFRLPVAFLSSIGGPLRMESSERQRLIRDYAAWALRAGGKAKCLIGVYWEKEWEKKVVDLKEEFGILEEPPLTMKEWRAEGRRLKAIKAQAAAPAGAL